MLTIKDRTCVDINSALIEINTACCLKGSSQLMID